MTHAAPAPRLPSPSPDRVREARKLAKHTQDEAAEVVHSTGRRWREWESGKHSMTPATWELYLLRTQAIIFKEPAMLAGTPKANQPKEKDTCETTFIL